MNQTARLHLQTLDWDELWRRTKRFVERGSRDGILTSAVVALAVTPIVMLLERDVVRTAVAMFAIWAAGAGWRLLRSRRQMAAVAGYEGDTGELLFFYRRELEDRLRATRVALVLVPVWLALLAYRIGRPLDSTREWVGFAGVELVLLGSSAYVWLVRRPRIARELQALKADLQPR